MTTAQAEAEVLPTITESNGGGYSALLDRAMTTGASPEVWDRILTLQERWEKMQSRKVFDEHLALAKAELPIILKNKQVRYPGKGGGTTSYMHETLAGLVDTVQPILSKHGISFRFQVENSLADNTLTVTCILWGHGYREDNASQITARPDETGSKNDIQGLGSAQTYLTRYVLKAALGLATSEDAARDDDGRSTSDPVISAQQVADLEVLIKETSKNPKVTRGTIVTNAARRQMEEVKDLKDLRLSYYKDVVDTLKLRLPEAKK